MAGRSRSSRRRGSTADVAMEPESECFEKLGGEARDDILEGGTKV